MVESLLYHLFINDNKNHEKRKIDAYSVPGPTIVFMRKCEEKASTHGKNSKMRIQKC
jgi:hypothetical protein